MKNKNGFTLIELLVVISIIAMLTSIILVNIKQANIKAKDTAKIRTLSEVKTAVQMYFTDKGKYPSGDKGNLKTVLVDGKYIPSIIDMSQITYQAMFVEGDSRPCNENIIGGCQSYRLGIALGDRTNNALASDVNDAVGIFDGRTDMCVSGGLVVSGRNLCFAVKP
jgi:prepilin-type N-terminal cleavage/methylation domain-containing protein